MLVSQLAEPGGAPWMGKRAGTHPRGSESLLVVRGHFRGSAGKAGLQGGHWKVNWKQKLSVGTGSGDMACAKVYPLYL